MPHVAARVRRLEKKTRERHEPIITAGRATSSPGKGPQPTIVGSTYLLAFTVGTDDAFREFKVPAHYFGSPSIHMHWTKTSDVNESGKAVKWRVTLLQFAGDGGDLSASTTSVEYEDTYDNSGTTTRILHRTPNITIPDLTPNYYVGLKIEAVTPAGTAMASEPGLFSVDLLYTEYINR